VPATLEGFGHIFRNTFETLLSSWVFRTNTKN